MSMYADDSTIFLDNTERELRKAIEILENFYRLFGLQIHLEKTMRLNWGQHTLQLKWDQQFRLLGVDFDADTLRLL